MTTPDADGASCSLCGSAGCSRACARCGAPHHEDCWEYGGGCSIYGCAGSTLAEHTPASDAVLVVDDRSLPAPRPSVVRALGRLLARDLPALPRTMGTSLLAALLGGMAIMQAGFWSWEAVLVPALFTGGAFGLLAAYCGRLLHRAPIRTAMSGSVLSVLAIVLLVVDLPFLLAVLFHQLPKIAPWTGWIAFLTHAALIATLVVGVLVTATALSEAFLGPRSRLGVRWLGPSGAAGIVLRLLATAGLTYCLLHAVGALHIALIGYSGPASLYLRHAVIGSVALTGVAWPVLERGKQEYLARLPPGRRGLPTASEAS